MNPLEPSPCAESTAAAALLLVLVVPFGRLDLTLFTFFFFLAKVPFGGILNSFPTAFDSRFIKVRQRIVQVERSGRGSGGMLDMT